MTLDQKIDNICTGMVVVGLSLVVSMAVITSQRPVAPVESTISPKTTLCPCQVPENVVGANSMDYGYDTTTCVHGVTLRVVP